MGALAGILSALVECLGTVAPFLLAHRAGRRSAQADQAEKTAEVKDAQLNVASRGRSSADELLGRMYDNDL